MIQWILATVVSLAIPVAALGQDWRYFVGNYGIHKVFTEGTGNTPDGQAVTTFTLACRPQGGKGHILIFFGLRDADKMKSLDLAYFEGPDAPAQHKRLVTVKVKAKQGEAIFTLKASGAFSDMDNTKDFQFEIGRAPARLISLLRNGAEKISIRVRDDRHRRQVVYTEFPAEGARAAFSELVNLGCK